MTIEERLDCIIEEDRDRIRKWANGDYTWPMFQTNGMEKGWCCGSEVVLALLQAIERMEDEIAELQANQEE